MSIWLAKDKELSVSTLIAMLGVVMT